MSTDDADEPLVRVDDLQKYFWENDSLLDRLLGDEPVAVRAVDGVSFDIREGETLGLVGESGCGKSTTGETLLRLQEPSDGDVRFDGRSVYDLERETLDEFRREAQVVFQDPFSSLDPRMTIGEIVTQPLEIHDWPWTDPEVETVVEVRTDGISDGIVTATAADDIDKLVSPTDGVATAHVTVRPDADSARPAGDVADDHSVDIADGVVAEVTEDLTVEVTRDDGIDVHVSVERGPNELRRKRATELLERVGLAVDQLDRYPHEFSGGQRQRIGIARSLALEPGFLVLDEPTSALDVSVQAQVLNLLADLQEEFDLTYLLISHDLSVVRHICDRVAVMYLGEIVEIGPVEEMFEMPAHPYTQALLDSVPRASTAEKDRDVETLSGDVPSPRSPPSGCRFRTRCPTVIPPAESDLDQERFRDLMNVRERIETRDVSLETVGDDDRFEFENGSLPDEEVDEFVAALKERLLDRELPPAHDAVVEEALSELATTDWEAAAMCLREEYESVCERKNPPLSGANTSSVHPTACHLYDESVPGRPDSDE
ncbi:ABC transporter ATP-binding protein [Natronobacterium gregoryi]|uniref:ABC transporter ATP-binding protein n=2 Tax=Natronobacterium gregoryi TaxID=44930 RepID=L0AM22_NATGS|nr:oligopeptide/dipeptide ABC transporter ATP-binding protein [Natronobacterium gregoryi]AFZ74846.1 oligopeptide/dipeptide ABC transporter, ATP-binding protein [Natronobacterium gregoryi SP2]ELY64593.1 oligopeptide/dipeptide ABC transporter ATPase [Natronobacterium gregoryi SP2]PLK18152.1 ABC transporter ATP-binding protein [Natronobacterium gregoryi SP2]SFJ66474.1 peptide/nickel transport system ATP-binding protein [Natronobacterium gregoryi]